MTQDACSTCLRLLLGNLTKTTQGNLDRMIDSLNDRSLQRAHAHISTVRHTEVQERPRSEGLDNYEVVMKQAKRKK